MAPNHGLKYPKCVLTQKGWYLLISEAFEAWNDGDGDVDGDGENFLIGKCCENEMT